MSHFSHEAWPPYDYAPGAEVRMTVYAQVSNYV